MNLKSDAWPPAGRSILVCSIALLLWGIAPRPAQAQLQSEARTTARERPRVFLDCQERRNCDQDHFRTEIVFVNWVRDRTDADVHVIFTSTSAGDGLRYSFDFIGRGESEEIQDELTYTSSGTDVSSEVMDGLTQTLTLGLVRYAVQTGLGNDLVVEYENGGSEGESAVDAQGNGESAETDPWNFWTFRMGLSGNIDLRETQKSSRLNPSLSANRVTDAWKLEFSLWANVRTDRRQRSDGSWFNNDQTSWRASSLIVRSVSPHVSMGIDAGANNSVQGNQRARIRATPAVEYNYYPYEQANRRQMIAQYAIGLEHSSYYEETVYETLSETLPTHQLRVQYRAREAWGNSGIGIESAQYIHDMGLYSFSIDGDLSYRITRGLEINLSAGAAFVQDNIHTPAADIDDEDIVSGRQSLPSSYRYEASLGFNYRWGSSFANIVNNRFPRGGGGGGGPGGRF